MTKHYALLKNLQPAQVRRLAKIRRRRAIPRRCPAWSSQLPGASGLGLGATVCFLLYTQCLTNRRCILTYLIKIVGLVSLLKAEREKVLMLFKLGCKINSSINAYL